MLIFFYFDNSVTKKHVPYGSNIHIPGYFFVLKSRKRLGGCFIGSPLEMVPVYFDSLPE